MQVGGDGRERREGGREREAMERWEGGMKKLTDWLPQVDL